MFKHANYENCLMCQITSNNKEAGIVDFVKKLFTKNKTQSADFGSELDDGQSAILEKAYKELVSSVKELFTNDKVLNDLSMKFEEGFVKNKNGGVIRFDNGKYDGGFAVTISKSDTTSHAYSPNNKFLYFVSFIDSESRQRLMEIEKTDLKSIINEFKKSVTKIITKNVGAEGIEQSSKKILDEINKNILPLFKEKNKSLTNEHVNDLKHFISYDYDKDTKIQISLNVSSKKWDSGSIYKKVGDEKSTLASEWNGMKDLINKMKKII